MKEVEAQGLEPPEVIAAIRLLMLTGCRRSEILTLHWDHVDLEAGELRLPDSKTGAKTVHPGGPAIAVLRAIPRRAGDPFVIAGSAPGRPMKHLHQYWQRIRRRAGLEGVRIHDLRHFYASGGLPVGEGLPMIGKAAGPPPSHNRPRPVKRRCKANRRRHGAAHAEVFTRRSHPVSRPAASIACRPRGPGGNGARRTRRR